MLKYSVWFLSRSMKNQEKIYKEKYRKTKAGANAKFTYFLKIVSLNAIYNNKWEKKGKNKIFFLGEREEHNQI